MKKRISVFLISILLYLACAFPVWAGTVSRLDDQAGLLDAEQQESLSSTLDRYQKYRYSFFHGIHLPTKPRSDTG